MKKDFLLLMSSHAEANSFQVSSLTKALRNVHVIRVQDLSPCQGRADQNSVTGATNYHFFLPAG